MFLSLELLQGQKIGFEVKDDIHIDKHDGTTKNVHKIISCLEKYVSFTTTFLLYLTL